VVKVIFNKKKLV